MRVVLKRWAGWSLSSSILRFMVVTSLWLLNIFICCYLGVFVRTVWAFIIRILPLVLPSLVMLKVVFKKKLIKTLGLKNMQFLCIMSALICVILLLSFYYLRSRFEEILCMCILGPVAEECFYRGFIISLLAPENFPKKRKSLKIAVLISVVYFALGHINYVIKLGIQRFFLQFFPRCLIIGFALTIAFIYFRTIYAPIVLHILLNFSNYTIRC